MLISQLSNNSFVKFDNLQIYKKKNGAMFLALRDNEAKVTHTAMPVDINVEASTKEAFLDELKKCTINTPISHVIKTGLIKELYS